MDLRLNLILSSKKECMKKIGACIQPVTILTLSDRTIRDCWLLECQLTSVKWSSVERRKSFIWKIKCSHQFRSSKQCTLIMIYYVSQTETIQEENSIQKGNLYLLVKSNFMAINNSFSVTLFSNFT